MKKSRPLWKTIIGIWAGIACLGVVIVTTQNPKAENAIVAVVLAIVCFLLFRTPTEKELARKAQRTEKIQHKIEQHEQSLRTCTMKHVNGLPIAENMDCTITSADDKFIFSSGSMHFELDKSKITDICIKTEQEIQEQYVSSVGGAVGGAMLFGTLGAMIGGRAKKKKVKNETHHYLIITYQSPDVKYIGFEIGLNLASAYVFESDFKKTASDTTVTL